MPANYGQPNRLISLYHARSFAYNRLYSYIVPEFQGCQMKDPKPSTLFQALADETRLQMLSLLRQHGELCVCDLENVLGITQSKASRHLRYLFNAGLVEDRRVAVWIHYRISENLNPAQTMILDSMEKLLDPRLVKALDSKLAAWMKQKNGGATDLKQQAVSSDRLT
jgi:ArsR family transcriptional regulator